MCKKRAIDIVSIILRAPEQLAMRIGLDNGTAEEAILWALGNCRQMQAPNLKDESTLQQLYKEKRENGNEAINKRVQALFYQCSSTLSTR